ncbi:MAG TPA: hypothetical protein VM889_03960 [Candidatus Thermoplasmatota archaeon]|nr:hypothetical protein [Candidatus Thermoplasmatota archaeon]
MTGIAEAVGADLALLSAATSGLVAALAGVLAVVAFRAAARRANPALRFVGAAFVVFVAKNVFSGYNVMTHAVRHDEIELALSVFDLAILLLLVMPLLRRRSA